MERERERESEQARMKHEKCQELLGPNGREDACIEWLQIADGEEGGGSSAHILLLASHTMEKKIVFAKG